VGQFNRTALNFGATAKSDYLSSFDYHFIRRIIMRMILTIAMVLAISLSACNSANKMETSKAKVLALTNDIVTALNIGDAKKLTDNFSEEATLVLPNVPIIFGRESIRSWQQIRFDNLYFDVSLYSEEDVQVDGQLAFHKGSFKGTVKPKKADQNFPIEIKFFHIAERQANGFWKLSSSFWSDDNIVFADACGSTETGKSCCCKSISGWDCIKGVRCPSDYPIPIVMP
jgi:ketosteroid isomerase-like protein